MSLLGKVRSAVSGWFNHNPADERNWTPFGAMPTLSGVAVNEQSALTFSAVYGCVRVLSETVAQLPWNAYEQTGNLRQRRADHPVDRLLHRSPNPEMTAFVFRETLQAHVCTWGNGYAEIERSLAGTPLALWPIAPHLVTPKRDSRRQVIYEVASESGERSRTLPAADVYHVKGLGFDGLVGYSPVRLAMQSIGLGLAAEQFGSAFFGNGANMGGILEHAAELSDKGRKNLKSSVDEFRGAKNSHKFLLLEYGTQWKPITVPPEEAQFLETRKFQVTDVCRWFRVPPHKLADLERATFSNIEQQSIDFVTDSIVPWLVRWEQEADGKLFSDSEVAYFTKLVVQGLLRGDSKQRGEYYKIMRDLGVLSINDIRELEDLNPLGPVGDLRLVPMNMVSIEHAGEKPQAPAPPPEPSKDDDQQDEKDEDAVAILLPIFEHGIKKVVAKEANAIARAEKKHADLVAFTDWVTGFYPTIAEYLSRELDAPLVTLRLLIKFDVDRLAVNQFVQVYIDASTAQLIEAKRKGTVAELLNDWKTERPATVAKALVETLKGVANVAA